MRIYDTFNEGVLVSERDILDKYILRDESMHNKFYVFDRKAEFDSYCEQNKNNGLHEIILENHKQRIKFDIDIDDVTGVIEKNYIEKFLEKFMETLNDELMNAWPQVYPTNDSWYITSSSKPGIKYSFHIISKYYIVNNVNQAHEFTQYVYMNLPDEFKKYVDMHVNKKYQNFRIYKCAKANSDRYKLLYNGDDNALHPSDLCIAIRENYAAYQLLPDIVTNTPRVVNADTNNALVNDVNEFLINNGILDNSIFYYWESRNNLLIYHRYSGKSNHCRICEREHTSENTLMIVIDNNRLHNQVDIYELCRRDTTRRSIYHGAIARINNGNTQQGPVAVPREDKLEKFINTAKEKMREMAALPPKYNNASEYNDVTMHDFEFCPTLLVRAEMKMGKTKSLKRYITTHFADRDIWQNRIIFISFRQTFSNDIAGKFEDFKLYNDIEGDINLGVHNKIIIQVESLHRIKIVPNMDAPDLIILDESESIFSQFNSGLHKHFNASFATFNWLIKKSRHVICMDANLGERTTNMIHAIRGPEHIYHHNKYKNMTNDIYYITSDKDKWQRNLLANLQLKYKIAIPTNSLADAKALRKLIGERFPTLSIGFYTSELTPSEKKHYFTNVNIEWKKHDVIIYTPTCSAGVSFEESHFDMVMACFTDTSCDVETCRQMIGRVRIVGLQQYYIHISARHMDLPTECAEIKRIIQRGRAAMFTSGDCPFEYDNAGNITIPDSLYTKCWLENKRIENLSRNCFDYRFIKQTLMTGADVEIMDDTLDNIEVADLEEIKSQITAQHSVDLEFTRDITEAEATSYKEKNENQLDLTPREKLELERYYLRWFYDIYDVPLLAQLIHNIKAPQQKRWFVNIINILAHPFYKEGQDIPITEVLEMFSKMEREEMTERARMYDFNADNSNLDHMELQKYRYMSRRHKIAIMLLCGIGFEHIYSRRYVDATAIVNFMRGVKDKLNKSMTDIGAMFDCRKCILFDDNLLAGSIKLINSIIHHMYGIKLRKMRAPRTDYKLDCDHSFIITDDKNETRLIYEDKIIIVSFITRQ